MTETFAEGDIANKFHREKRYSGQLTDFVDLNDIRVIQAALNACFTIEALHEIRLEHLRLDFFDSDRAIELVIKTFKDFAHSTRAKLADDFKALTQLWKETPSGFMVESGLFGEVFGMAAMNWSGKVILVLLADEGFEFSEANFAVIDMVRDLVEFVIEKVPLSGLLQKDKFRAWFRERIDGRIIHE